ncbi:MAG: peptidoglycan glycosyltransferase [Actinobacteria bacterium 13_1_20CM_3_71_11]|nr:MAG: peptidoglycan glycosyltransferase [Actinobacteria bacterium 13_1_20CM_3_71_11]
MNAPLRRVGVVVIALFALLFVNLNYVQAYKADAYRNDDHNARVQLTEYERQRGTISTHEGIPIAQSVPTSDQLKYLRTYPLDPLAYAPITGYKPVSGLATNIERAQDSFLSGNADSLFTERLRAMFTGAKTSGGNVQLTILKSAQEKAYADLVHNNSGAKNGAAVVLDPRSGAILAMATTPSYDPNQITGHDSDAAQAAFTRLQKDPANPLLDRATQNTYPPGSTMKVIISAAALSSGEYTPQTEIQAGPDYTPVQGGGFTIHNAVPSICPDPQITLILALTQSCNTGFAALGVKLGGDKVKAMAQAFGFEDNGLTIAGSDNTAMRVVASHTGAMTGDDGRDDPNKVAQSSIGQLDVRVTPLQGAMVAAAVANNGTEMRPYLVDKLQAPDLTTTDVTQPRTLHQPISSQVAGDLRTMMISVVQNGTGKKAQVSGFDVGGKTGTAQNGEAAGDHGWFIGFAMKGNEPICAVAVFLQNAGPGGSSEAARIAGDLMKTVITARGLK